MINHTYIVIATPVCSVCNHNLSYPISPSSSNTLQQYYQEPNTWWCCGAVDICQIYVWLLFVAKTQPRPRIPGRILVCTLHENTNTLLRGIWWWWWASSPVCMQLSVAKYWWNFICYALMTTDTRNHKTVIFTGKLSTNSSHWTLQDTASGILVDFNLPIVKLDSLKTHLFC